MKREIEELETVSEEISKVALKYAKTKTINSLIDNFNTKELLDAVLPKFEGTKGELFEAINKLAEETHEQWVRDIEAREALEPHFEA